MTNPFIPTQLIGRQAELAQVKQVLLKDGDLLVAGVPRSGRRSLIRTAASQIGARTLEIDCLEITNASQFVRRFADAITSTFNQAEDITYIERWSLAYPLLVDKTAHGLPSLVWSSGASKEWLVFEALLTLPQCLAEWLDCRVVVVFQNFPHIRSWDRQGKWEAHLRQVLQQQTRVSYALISTVIEPWAYASQLATFLLPPIEDAAIADWCTLAMAQKDLYFAPDGQALQRFLTYVQGHVGDAITLARRIWLDHQAFYRGNSGLIEPHHVHSSILGLVDDLAVMFESLILLLPPSQVRLLESLALDPTESPHASSYIKKHQLSRGGGLQGALNSLEHKGLVYGPKYSYRIALPLLDFWLKHRLHKSS